MTMKPKPGGMAPGTVKGGSWKHTENGGATVEVDHHQHPMGSGKEHIGSKHYAFTKKKEAHKFIGKTMDVGNDNGAAVGDTLADGQPANV